MKIRDTLLCHTLRFCSLELVCRFDSVNGHFGDIIEILQLIYYIILIPRVTISFFFYCFQDEDKTLNSKIKLFTISAIKHIRLHVLNASC